MMLESRINPTLAGSTAAVAENFFNVFREVRIEDRGLAGFFFVRLG